MLLKVTASLVYSATQTCDAMLQIEPSTDGTQRCDNPRLTFAAGTSVRQAEGEDTIGLRRWISVDTQLDCHYETEVKVNRPAADLGQLRETPRFQLPGAVVQYLMPSRYCQSDLFLEFTAAQFQGLKGGALVLAMNDWVASNFTYDIFTSDPGTTATDSFASLRGVCRDYAHVLIALIRAVGIPARFVSAYAPDVNPQDFHAVVEVFLEGDWHLIDPTDMAKPADIVRICVGRDAADASFLTSYGLLTLQEQSVQVQRTAA
ncbi:transglutaminase family protein [bacterium]|nr:transglutaminase family protein [bacterium]